MNSDTVESEKRWHFRESDFPTSRTARAKLVKHAPVHFDELGIAPKQKEVGISKDGGLPYRENQSFEHIGSSLLVGSEQLKQVCDGNHSAKP